MRYGWIIPVFLAGLAAGWFVHDAWHVSTATGIASPSTPRRSATAAPPETPDLASLAMAGQLGEVIDRIDGNPDRLIRLMARLPPDSALALAQAFGESREGAFAVNLAAAGIHEERGAYESALDALLQASLLVESERDERQLTRKLADVTDAWSRALIGREDFDSVDRMYQSITLAMPERAEYFLKLGMLRMRMGDFERALIPLAHIENHDEWGARARELIAQAEASEVRDAPGQERLALRSAGSQFVVEARIDHGRSIHLLVDTGAAMTIIDESLLAGLGYPLANRRQEYFATAGGVVEAPVVTIGHLGLGNAGISELPVGALPLGIDGINGLLGMNFLRHYEFRIDQREKILYLDSHH